MSTPREPGLIKRGVCWLLLLGPLFFLSYGLANNHAAGLTQVGSLVFEWETRVPLWPWTILPYWSIDLLYGLSFLLPRTRREMDRHALALLSAQLICIACFLLWPLRFTFERPALDGAFGWLFDVLMGFDKPFNQAPSLHIALLVIIWTMFARHTRGPLLRGAMHGWMALIGLSVLTTWQHHFIDLPTGALAGFLCVWLWPAEGPLPLQQARWSRNARRWRLAAYYGLGALVLGAIGVGLAHGWLWLAWPAVALLMVALNYAAIGPAGFQKGLDGHLSNAATWLFAPYLIGAWLNSRLWTRHHPAPDEICAGVHLGRIPCGSWPCQRSAGSWFTTIIDLTAELPCTVAPGQHYRSLPNLDLIPPDTATCHEAAHAIEALHKEGPLLVCCALGYSRSATAVAAWLLLSGRCADLAEAEALIRRARPGIVLHPAHRQILESLR